MFDLRGTEWATTEGDISTCLKFYPDDKVTLFIANGPSVSAVTGSYEYISIIKKVYFKDVHFYDRLTNENHMELRGAQIFNNITMKTAIWTGENYEEKCLFIKR